MPRASADSLVGLTKTMLARRVPGILPPLTFQEAIETTKRFGADHGHTYVNGVLDKAAAELRPVEVQAARDARR